MATQGRAQTEVGNKGKKRPEHDHAKCEHIRQDIHIQESRRRTPTYYIKKYVSGTNPNIAWQPRIGVMRTDPERSHRTWKAEASIQQGPQKQSPWERLSQSTRQN